MSINKNQVVNQRLPRFKELSRLIRPFFRLENIELNFTGLESTLIEYQNMDTQNPQQSFEVIKNLLLWIDYLQSLHGVIKTSLMKLENRRLYLEAFREERRNSKLEEMVADTSNNKDLCSYYEKELAIQIKFFNFAYRNAITEYNENIRK